VVVAAEVAVQTALRRRVESFILLWFGDGEE
jgi:hypothetical protein